MDSASKDHGLVHGDGGALGLVRLYRLRNLFDGKANKFAAVIAAELKQRRDSAKPSAVRARSRIGGEFLTAIWREDRGIDVRIRVAPEAGAITPDGVVVDIVNGERPKQRPDPSISAVAMSPPPVRGATAMPARQRSSRGDLPAQRRIAEPEIDDGADVLRPQRSRPELTVTGQGTRVT